MDEFENNVDLDEVAQNEPPHLDIHCLPSSIWILNMIHLGLEIFWKFADENFVVYFLVDKELTIGIFFINLKCTVFTIFIRL